MPVKILVVEDEALIAEELMIRLQRRGYLVIGPVDTADAAYALVERERPDLILMDIRLKGGTDGITAAEQIHRLHDIPVVFLTANADDATYRRAQLAAQYGYVHKPFHERDLLMALDLALHRNAVERELRRTNLTHATISAAVQVGIIATDVDGIIRYANPAAEQLLGRSLLDLVNHPLAATLQAADEVTASPIPLPLPAVGIPRYQRLATIQTAAAGAVPAELLITPILSADGRSIGMVCTLRDLRAQRERETQQRQREKMVAVGQLAGGIAHEFNNLLTVISGNAELLAQAETADAENQAIADAVVDASRRAAGLVEQLLQFSQQEPDATADTDANAAIVAAEPLLRLVLGETVELVLRLDEGIGRVPLAASAMEEILVALVRNAREATVGTGRVVVATRRVRRDEARRGGESLQHASVTGQAVEITVTDTGIGIAPEHLSRVFEPFYTTKDPGQGPGMGLPTVFAIVRRAHGYIEATSSPGLGTTIRILLPECAPAFAERTVAARVSETPTAAALHGAVLVVEDDATVRAVTTRMLRLQGHEVIEAGDVYDALNLLRDSSLRIALMLSDVAMPHISGMDLLLKARVIRPQLPVLLMSGHASDSRWRSIIDEADAPFLPKPFTRQQLDAAITAALATA